MSTSALVPSEQWDYQVGWLCIRAEGKSSHVLPANDLRGHECSSECWCRPVVDEEEDMVIHNSMDRREYIERGDAQAQ